jgi:heme/copper-type cytochrome/quinol oxidase subunit 2
MSTTSASRKLEMVALLIPTSGVVVLNQLVIGNAAVTPSLFSDLAGLQWYWIFDGSDITLTNGISIGQLFGVSVNSSVVLAGSAIGTSSAIGCAVVLLSAVDVIHAVALPTLGVKADAIPGRLVSVKISSDVSGSFSGQCSELCGAMHAFMPLQVAVVQHCRLEVKSLCPFSVSRGCVAKLRSIRGLESSMTSLNGQF